MTPPEKEFPPFHLGDRLRKAREAATDLDRKAFAKHIGIAPDTLRRYETGATRPRRPVLAAWALATGFTVEQLTGEAQTDPPSPDGGLIRTESSSA
jgi:transcriptional regulator with XRE-family HTH domain